MLPESVISHRSLRLLKLKLLLVSQCRLEISFKDYVNFDTSYGKDYIELFKGEKSSCFLEVNMTPQLSNTFACVHLSMNMFSALYTQQICPFYAPHHCSTL